MRQFTTVLLSAALLSAVSVSAQADTLLGIYGGVDGIFVQDQSGEQDTNDDVVASYYLAFEHPVPFLPNAKIRYMTFDKSETTVISGASVSAKGEAELLDLIAYYEILDNIVSVDVGAGAKRLNTDISAVATNNGAVARVTQEYDETIPALYASAGGKLPFTGLSAKAEGFVGKSSDADFTDFNAEIKYNFVENMAIDLGVKVGYRAMDVNFEDDSEMTVRGPYLGLEAHF